MNMLVSILIPVYNRENLIEATILSAINQTYKNIEIIVVDNQSTDKTWEILQKLASKYDRIKIFQNETNIGPVRNWKRCIDEASGEYGKILWSDDLIAPEFLEKTVSYLTDANIGFVFTRTYIFENESTNTQYDMYGIGNTNIYPIHQYINGILLGGGSYPVSPGCAIFRLKDLKENLLINIPNKIGSDFSMHAIGNDLLIFLLTAHQYKSFVFVNEHLSFFRAHKDSISIQSTRGVLPFYYDIAKAYFVENYRKDLVEKLNANLVINYIRFKNVDLYKNFLIKNFYMHNKNEKVDYMFLLKKILNKLGL